MSRYYIIGTGTDVGKTYVSGVLLRQLLQSGRRAAYYKPVMSGNPLDKDGQILPLDPLRVKAISGTKQEISTMAGYVYQASLSPHLAARFEGPIPNLDTITAGVLRLDHQADLVLIEGCGGIICPIIFESNRLMQSDIIKHLSAKTILVADAGLGTINATVLTTAFLKNQGINVRGIILNRYQAESALHQDNRVMIETLSGVPVIATLSEGAVDLVWSDGFSLEDL